MMQLLTIAIEWVRTAWMVLTVLLLGAIVSSLYHPLPICLLVEPLAREFLDGADLTYLSVAFVALASSAATLILSGFLWALAHFPKPTQLSQ